MEGAAYANIDVYGEMNSFDIGYFNGPLTFKTGARNNIARILNDVATSANVVDIDGTNQWTLTCPTSGTMLPITQSTGLTPVSGTTYQNTYGVPIVLYATALLTPSSSAAYYFAAYLGPSAGSLQAVLQAVTPAGGGQHGYPVTLKVPAGWYYSFSFTGTGASGGWDGKVCVSR